MKRFLCFAALLWPFAACSGSDDLYRDDTGNPPPMIHDHDGDGKPDHNPHDHSKAIPLGQATVGEWLVNCSQGQGRVQAGQGSHFVVQLPFDDQGATTVRAWMGHENRESSQVATATYEASHGDYDAYVVLPDPLPDRALWWIEIERPDGTKATGSIAPQL